jgi:hypothetical protein
MDRNQLLLALALHECSVPLTVTRFENRLLVQKVVYLLQNRGVELGYPYRWYLHGPYSSRVANDLFCLARMDEDEAQELKKYTFGGKTKAIIAQIKDLLAPGEPLKERAKRVELLASVLFLVRTGQAGGSEQDRLVEILEANDKRFDASQVHEAVVSLRGSGYAL